MNNYLNPQYSRKIMAQALVDVGLKNGDIVFSHSNVGYFGFPEEGRTAKAVFETILGAFQDVVGQEGTLVVPTFSYSFCKREPFDPENTASTCGIFTEMLRHHPNAYRSVEPIFSVAAIGRQAKELTTNVPAECFGQDSFWDRFLQGGGIICNLNFDAGSTFIHYIERCLNVPYRYDKLFTGTFIVNGQSKKGAAIYFCQDLTNPDTVAAFELFDVSARRRGQTRSAAIGRGALVSIRATDVNHIVQEELQTNPWILTVAGKTGKSPVILRPLDAKRFNIPLEKNANMEQITEALWRLPRDIISDSYEAALDALSAQIPMTIHKYPTGTHCWTWIIPEKWICHEAYLETLDGKRLFSYGDNPLHVVSYSLPYERTVSREELFQHLYVHPKNLDAIPFKFKYYERDWGLCCSQKMKDSLTDDHYRVKIKTDFSFGELRVGEVVIPGNSEDSIVLCAHLCHPAMANDGLSGVAVGIEVMRRLNAIKPLCYTYRFLILPETIGSIAWLSHNEQLIPKIKGGLYLEMLGTNLPPSLQQSFFENSQIDKCFMHALATFDKRGWTGKYRSIIGNDERQFNAPGVRIPMLSLSRVHSPEKEEWPYPEYHSHLDNLALISEEKLKESVNLVLSMIDTLEKNYYVINKFKGEVFCSRYGIHIDFYTNPLLNKRMFEVMDRIDGTRTVADIAEECSLAFKDCWELIDILRKHDLIDLSRRKQKIILIDE